VPRFPSSPPEGAKTSTIFYRVPFYDTDAMRIVHHARYVHYFELARIAFLDEHDRPYREYVAEGLHYAVTRCELAYQMPARFDDRLGVTCWIDWLKRVSLAIGYVIRRGDDLIATGATEHAMVSDEGKLVAIPPGRRSVLQAALGR
jgi:acyl-CoA thioester hydrolase